MHADSDKLQCHTEYCHMGPGFKWLFRTKGELWWIWRLSSKATHLLPQARTLNWQGW
jgi:hypothetical protein